MVSIPPLWGVWEYDWVQWAGSIQHPLARNIAQVIGVNAALFSWARTSPQPPSEKKEIFRSSIDVASLKTLEGLAKRLHPPRWPKSFPPINRELAARGKDLYHGNKLKRPLPCRHEARFAEPKRPKPARHDDPPERGRHGQPVSGEFLPTYRRPRTSWVGPIIGKRRLPVGHHGIDDPQRRGERP